jgi:hypothetical protein
MGMIALYYIAGVFAIFGFLWFALTIYGYYLRGETWFHRVDNLFERVRYLELQKDSTYKEIQLLKDAEYQRKHPGSRPK